MHAAQESARRADARESFARRRRAESESAIAMDQNIRDTLEAEFGPISTISQP
jgi:hypothetical protein